MSCLHLLTPETLRRMVELGYVEQETADPYFDGRKQLIQEPVKVHAKPFKPKPPKKKVVRSKKPVKFTRQTKNEEQKKLIIERLVAGDRPAAIAHDFPCYTLAGIKSIRFKLCLPDLDKKVTFTKPRKRKEDK